MKRVIITKISTGFIIQTKPDGEGFFYRTLPDVLNYVNNIFMEGKE